MSLPSPAPRRFGSLRLRLLLLILLAVLPPALVTLWEQNRNAEDRLAEAGRELQDLAVNTAREQAALIGHAQTLLAALARLPAITDGAPEDCQPVLRSLSGGAPWQRSLGVYGPDGQPICTDQASGAGLSIADQSYMQAALSTRRFVLSDLVIGRLVPVPMVMAVQPVIGIDGLARRLIVLGIDIAQLGDLTRPQLPAGAEAMLLADAGGTIVARFPPAPDILGRNLRGTGLAPALSGRAGHGSGTGLAGATRLFGYAPIPGTRAVVVVGRDPATVLAGVHSLQRQVLLLAGGSTLLALALALLAGRMMLLRPMTRFATVIRRIAAGDLEARAATGRFGGEFGSLAAEVNGMAARLAAHQAEMARKNAELAGLADALAAARDSAEAASAAKTRFVSTLSHELRTPLNGIFGHAQLLQADPGLTPMQRRCAEQITACGEHLMSMIRELLDLAAIEAGKVTLQPAPVRLAAFAESCAALIRPAATAKGLAFGVELAPRAAGWVQADPLRLRQVLLNLLGNAVKFTAEGEVVLRIHPAAGGLIRFEVSDTGPGMTEAERTALFREFMRLPGTAGAEGSGLGLAITARLVALMGGTVGCESEKGQGSLFWVELPLPASAPGEEPEAGLAAPLALGEPLRLLLADDVLVNREVARALLNAAGHAVEVVPDGARALEAALSEDWDAVLLDVHMPVMDGLTAARRIRAAVGPRGRVPILAVTASANQAEVAECLSAGMDAHVEKPLRAWELQNALADIRARGMAGRAWQSAVPG
ncbi:response regulator [Belnapia sp. T6]|uniref:histidine kinase n=1 Tax=Belnapia mucosa TaxID=2804532 RepID=A0ABS1UZG5_9PROT|nr:ATP-binding protein [Belnapia mucosa]MBL6454848.1 response regulator [Belnapia mucosa]